MHLAESGQLQDHDVKTPVKAFDNWESRSGCIEVPSGCETGCHMDGTHA